MIMVSINLACEECREMFLEHPWADGDTEDKVRLLLLTAELAGWKVYRLARDVYYGKAWCGRCREDKCKRCNGRGYYPDWKDWDSYHGEPRKKNCEVCKGNKYV